MKTNDVTAAEKFIKLIEHGVLTEKEFVEAKYTSAARGLELEQILVKECGVPRRILLQALSERYDCPSVEYDERLPVPPELLAGLDGERLSLSKWFPVIKDGDSVIIAASNPEDPVVLDEVRKFIKAEKYEFRVALEEDIQWFIQDFLHAKAGYLIGTERTGLAFWRNTMAHWRTRLACYRNDMAKARTDLALLRWGLGLTAISDTLMRTHKFESLLFLYWLMIAGGISLAVFGLKGYLKIRRKRNLLKQNILQRQGALNLSKYLSKNAACPGVSCCRRSRSGMIAPQLNMMKGCLYLRNSFQDLTGKGFR